MHQTITKQQVKNIYLLSLMISSPVSLGATLMMEGDTALWAALESVFGISSTEAVEYTGTSEWTKDPNASFTVVSPIPVGMPPDPINDAGDGSGGSGSGS